MNKVLYSFFLLMLFGNAATAQNGLLHPGLLNRLYAARQQSLYWYAGSGESLQLRRMLKKIIDSSAADGLDKNKYHYAALVAGADSLLPRRDSTALRQADRLLTDAAIAWCSDMFGGAGIGREISYDGLSASCRTRDEDYLLRGLFAARTPDQLRQFMQSLAPIDSEYFSLRAALRQQLSASAGAQSLTRALNLYRWMHHFRFPQWVVINIPSAMLRYYEYDSCVLQAKVVVGKPSTRTPRFAASCDEVILYPYWNVPRSIAVKELLPLFKSLPTLFDSLDMQLINASGRVVDRHTINWSSLSKTSFPYSIRQGTGCNNALGVVKFNLTSPYAVYLHDTNVKSAFRSSYRYYSHGCIRVEKPVELAETLLPGQVDSNFLRACYRDLRPITIRLTSPVPVFVVYATAGTDAGGRVAFYRDIYRLHPHR